MTMRIGTRRPSILVAAIAMAAAAAAPVSAAPAPPPGNAFNARLLALARPDRDGALRRAVTLGNQRCGRLTDTIYRGPYGNLAFWQVRCQPGGGYGVFLGSDGSTQIRPCADLVTLKLPACAPFPGAPVASGDRGRPAQRR
jgi:hypothetical protein